ncbi:long-chain-fatty-acid--CoA ligase 4 isoform X2 [Tribolium castaneum]|uniref:long-chain-fatty-acid--CoA ligase 4 isoform X2 n=1 Tax=Tribolium castaneum TaxID=7070 RepID=UPI00046C2B0F|nr:PREDICTED: long-chain-fatty-acid--CoA ligase 4 isoform X2 [Tribolium castaneum]|eukprot:XP_008193859.1 PREDICTED: long-chain-fatty-acid--CoA ligase 4 isoform X2 [Tribolium castaneum]
MFWPFIRSLKIQLDMDGVGITMAIGALRALAFVFDVLTFPVYVILQRPWRARALGRRVKAVIIATETESDNTDVSIDIKGNDNTNNSTEPSASVKAKPITQDTKSITYRSTTQPGKVHIQLVQEKIDTMAKMFDYVSKAYPNKRCLGTREILAEEDEVQKNGRVFKKYNMGDYKWKTFSEVNMLATNFGKGIRELGNEPGQNVAIFAETRAEWMIAAHGIFKQSIPLVTIYATLGDEAIAHGLNETEVTTVITSFDLMPKFKKILAMVPKVKTLIYMEDQLKKLDESGYKQGIEIIKFSEVLKRGANSQVVDVPPRSEDPAIIMYTSGSTGVPKGVILLHKNLIATLKAFCDSTDIYQDDVMIGFLPLAHVFELLVESVCLLTGVAIGYSSPLTMIDTASKIKKGTKGDATVLHPTCMTSVPLILDRISKSIQEKVSKGGPMKKVLFKFAYDYKVSWLRRGYSTPLIDRVVFGPIRALLGGRMRLILCGGAPLSPETHEQMNACLCATIIQGYGLTESTSCATVQDFYDKIYGRVGATTTVCDIKLVNWEEGNYRVTDKPFPRGEIILGGDNISAGYYKLSSKTDEDFTDVDGRRWFRTGDIGEIHPDGVVKIIDRKKDLVKLQAGEYVSLGKVEAQLKTCPLVDNICVYGDSSKQFCVALVVPNQQQLKELAAKKGVGSLSFEELCQSPEMEKVVIAELMEHGKKSKLEKFELPAAVKLVTEVWSPDMGLVTAAFKLKRKDIQERYKHEINRMYAS